MLDPIAYREETETTTETEREQPVETHSNSALAETSGTPTELSSVEPQKFLIMSDNEIVEIQSNVLLPSGLKVYNESGGNTYIEYLTASLAPIPELNTGHTEVLYQGFSSLFLGRGLVFLFGMGGIFLFKLLFTGGAK